MVAFPCVQGLWGRFDKSFRTCTPFSSFLCLFKEKWQSDFFLFFFFFCSGDLPTHTDCILFRPRIKPLRLSELTSYMTRSPEMSPTVAGKSVQAPSASVHLAVNERAVNECTVNTYTVDRYAQFQNAAT